MLIACELRFPKMVTESEREGEISLEKIERRVIEVRQETERGCDG